jgi:putative ABC transport system substrate-binding protein
MAGRYRDFAMKRRELIKLVGAAAASSVWPLAARTQQPALPAVGVLCGQSADASAHIVAAFRGGLNAMGYVEGQSVALEFRWADGRYDQLAMFAEEFVRRPVALIVALDNMAAVAARKATTKIPIVFSTRGGPLPLGLVSSLNRPDTNITGVAFLGFGGSPGTRRLELLHNMVPSAQTVGVLLDRKALSYASERREAQEATRTVGVKAMMLTAGSEAEIDAAFATLSQRQIRALLLTASTYFTWERRDQILGLTARNGIATMYTLREWVADGGLMSYGIVLADTYRQVGIYAGKILKGATPGDLPVDQSPRFEFVINRARAQALGLEIPRKLAALADEVID